MKINKLNLFYKNKTLILNKKSSFVLIKKYSSIKDIKRGNYSKIEESDLKIFQEIVSSENIITDKQELEIYNQDWLKKHKGNSSIALFPKTTQQVSKILQHCNQRKLAVVPQGGNTGLVQGSIPLFDEIIISLKKMNQIEKINETTGIVECQSGVILEQLENKLHEHSLTVPIDLAAKGSCHIGGNIATNAGGIHLLRYGSLKGNVLGLEIVLANGKILENMSTLRKDNTGFDLKQIFIGSEGTLGIITKCSILCPPKPASKKLALFAVENFEKVLELLKFAKKNLGEVLSAFEMVDENSLGFCLKFISDTKNPFDQKYPFYILVEVAGSDQNHDEQKMNNFVEKVLSEEIVVNGIIAQDTKQMKSIWRLRESCAEALLKAAKCYKYDISLPLDHFYEIVGVMQKRIGERGVACGYGHVGDGNLHLNISSNENGIEELIEPFLYEWIKEKNGSVSAEHGIGLMKTGALKYSKSIEMIEYMHKIKDLFDPNSILNPYKVLPQN